MPAIAYTQIYILLHLYKAKKSREILKTKWRRILLLGEGERSLAVGCERLKGQLHIKHTMALCPSLLHTCLKCS